MVDAQSEKPQPNREVQASPEAPRKKLTEAFHFEDDTTTAMLMARYLKFDGIKSTHAATYPKAVLLFQERQELVKKGEAEPIPWAILDWDGIGGQGSDMAKMFHDESPSTALTVVTGRSYDNKDLQELREKGVDFSYLGKGAITLDDLKPHIERAEKILNNEPLDEKQ